MQSIDLSFAQDPNTLALALLVGMVPAVIWFYFWRHEDNKHPKRGGLFVRTFVGGVFAVIAVLPIQIWISKIGADDNTLNILWAGSEELLKFLVLILVAIRSPYLDEPVDYAIYMMAVAVGFAGFENALYFLSPLQTADTVGIFLSTTTRYLGSTLLHLVCSMTVGLTLGFAYFRGVTRKVIYGLLGLGLAVTLHSIFNYYIGIDGGVHFLQIFGALWIVAFVLLFIFEILRARGTDEYRKQKRLEAVRQIEGDFLQLLTEYNIQESIETSIQSAIHLPEGKSAPRKLIRLVEELRLIYRAYLMSQGAPKKDAEATTGSLITEAISPKAVRGIINTLKM